MSLCEENMICRVSDKLISLFKVNNATLNKKGDVRKGLVGLIGVLLPACGK